jgi:perosamine synthetase
MSKIPLSVPSLKGNEAKYLNDCVEKEWVSSAGQYVNDFEEKISRYVGARYSVACVNGTAALHIALKVAGVKSGDEVIVPSLTFISSVNAISYNNASPVFMDSDEYFNIDGSKTIDFIKNKTRFTNGNTYNLITGKKISAIIPVHVWGNACLLDDLYKICIEKNIIIIEDAAESLGTKYLEGAFKGKHTGTVGELGCLSFNGNKIITSGGGGMLLTDNESLAIKAKHLTTQAKLDPLNYIHDDIGYNFRLTNLQAAVGVAQLEQLPLFLNKKKDIFSFYKRNINEIDGLSIYNTPDYSSNNHWLNVLRIDKKKYKHTRDDLIKRFYDCNIEVRPVWGLNHKQTPYKDCQNYKISTSDLLVENSLCLPSSVSLSEKDLNKILSVLNG